MATKLIKTVKRELFSTDRKGVPLIVELQGGDMLVFRSKGKRLTHELYIGHAYMMAQIMSAEKRYADAKAEYARVKKLYPEKRLRKPRKPNVPFNKIYFKALSQ